MNRKSKVVKKQQKNQIDSYFGKKLRKSNAIYLERLQEEIGEQCIVDDSGIEFASQGEKNNVEAEEKQVDEIDKNYVNELKERIEFLENKCKELTKQNEKVLKDNRALKKMLDASKNLNLIKDVKIQKMASQCVSDRTALQHSEKPEKMSVVKLFGGFEQHFSTEQLNELRSIGKGKRGDAKFILKCLEFLYDKDVRKISQKCSGDRKLRGKTVITPQKKNLMVSLLNERVEGEGVVAQMLTERCNRLNRLIGDGLYTLINRRSPREFENSMSSQITSTFTAQTHPVQNSFPNTSAVTSQNLPAQNSSQNSSTITTAITSQNVPNQPLPQFLMMHPHQFDAFNYVSLPYPYLQ